MSQNDSTPPVGTPANPYGGPQTGFSGRGTRFFDWMRGLGIVRADGWLGGVSAGVAYRLGIDPLIVRGIIVVAGILGAPVLLLYAAAWALLPDRDGRIHLQQLFDGDFQPPMVAIGVMALLSLLPWTSGVWWADGPFWNVPVWGDAIGRVIWTLVVIGAVVALIVVAVRNSDARAAARTAGGAATTGAATADAASASMADAAPAASTSTEQPSDGDAAGTPSTTVPAASAAPAPAPQLDIAAEPTAPPAPRLGASPDEVADWQQRQAQWRAEHAAWKQRLAADMRAVKAQRSAELRTQVATATAEAAARREAYRAANPRVGAAVGWLTVGLALVAGSLVAIVWPQLADVGRFTTAAGLAAATLVVGVVVLIAGLARRRSGFLIFLGILLAALTAAALFLAGDTVAGIHLTSVGLPALLQR
ncbi:PspC domain-containing protein [Leifsonia soli]|uniref:Phage shock protein PspC (Stress-responsive transcriptional regulator) n=1 Tax=Leifsonia soli TaxID=582665 RepID=A0A852T5K5_9MICO|nr:PspC domain-containing protein [Leifsonia soli]NYD76132.1 phage shock protein PspC (stress-responsive transcriptional regulator) [Leifsonia soli]